MRPLRFKDDELRYVPLDGSGWPVDEEEARKPKRRSATVQIVDYVEELHLKRHGFALHIPGNQIRVQRKHAKEMLKRVGGDVELLKEALELQFLDSRFAWAESRYHLGHCKHDLERALHIVGEKRKRMEKKDRVDDSITRRLQSDENIWK